MTQIQLGKWAVGNRTTFYLLRNKLFLCFIARVLDHNKNMKCINNTGNWAIYL